MSLYLNTNTASINGQRQLANITANLNSSLERLGSGYKINSAADSPSGLVLSEGLRAQIRGSQAAIGNVQQGISMANAAGTAQTSSMDTLQRMRELAVEASNGTVVNFGAFTAEMTQLVAELDSNAATTYNSVNVADGTSGAINIQTGANTGDSLDISGAFADIDATALGVNAVSVASNANASAAIATIDTAITTLGTTMATTGGLVNRMDSISNNLSIVTENLTASEASIRNTDIAQETATLTRLQIMQQAAASSLSQANMMPSIALQLLG